MTDDPNVAVRRVKALERDIAVMLHGEGPEIQGSTLAALLATWVAGHHPDLREPLLDDWLELVRKLIPIEEFRAFGPGGFPKEGLS